MKEQRCEFMETTKYLLLFSILAFISNIPITAQELSGSESSSARVVQTGTPSATNSVEAIIPGRNLIEVPSNSGNGGPVATFSDPPVTKITIAGVDYSFEEAIEKLPKLLHLGSQEDKVKWLKQIRLFRTKLQGQGVPILTGAFKSEKDPVIRLAIVNAVNFSRDPNLKHFWLLATKDVDPSIVYFASVKLMKELELAGVDSLIEVVPKLKPEMQKRALLPFLTYGTAAKWDTTGLLKEIRTAAANTPDDPGVFVPVWLNWWKVNRPDLINNTK